MTSEYHFEYEGKKYKVYRGSRDRSVYRHDGDSSPFWYEIDRTNELYFEVRGHYLGLCLQELQERRARLDSEEGKVLAEMCGDEDI